MGIECPKCKTENTSDSQFCKSCATPLPLSRDIPVTKTLETPTDKLTPGTIFASRYEVIEELGKGGMGRVYRVKDEKLDEEIALKVLKPEIAADKGMIERFKNELKLARKIAHRSVCKMYDLNEEEDTPYITMEYVPGEDLKSFIRKKSKLTEEGAIAIAKQVCEGLTEAHALGVIHRDLKPQNIMIDEKNNAKVMDFGIARSVEAPGITHTGMMIGTPDYISPEQAEGEEADQRSDIYALGVILYEMITGTVPFKGDTALSVALKHKAQLPKEPRKLNPEVSEQLNRLILICMEKDRERRYQRAEELLSELRNIEEGFPLGTKLRPRREIFTSALIRKKVLIPALIVVLGIVVVALWQFLPQNELSSVSSGKPSLAVMYFKNNTGNEDLNYYREILSDILTDDLSQSKFIYVLPKERTYTILSKMDLLEAQNYTSGQLARIADLAVVDHLILGTYAKAGDLFRIATTLREAKTGEVVAVETIEDVEDKLFSMVDTLTERLKSHLGFSEQNIANDIDSNLSDITTNSVEAYKYYIEAMKHTRRSEWKLAIPFLERAVAIDPGFGMAFRSLHLAYMQTANPEKSRDAMLKAYELRDRVSERERLHIIANYHNMNQNRSQAIDTYKKLLEIYPEDPNANNSLGLFYLVQEEFEKAIERYTMPISKKADIVFLYDGLAFAYCGLGEYRKALEVLDQYLRDISDSSYIRIRISQIYYVEGKYDLALREADKLPGGNGIELKGEIYQIMGNLEQAEKIFQGLTESEGRIDRLWGIISLAELYYQQRRFPEAQEQLELGIELAEEIGLKGWKTELHIRLGFLFLRWGKPQRTLEECSNAGRTYMSSHLRGLAHLKLNQVESAQEEASELLSLLGKENNKNLIRHYYHLLGMIEHKQGNISRALEHFEAAVALLPFQRPLAQVGHPLFLEPLAEAYYATGKWDKALSVYERITNLTEERLVFSNIYVKAFYNLGKIYEQQGNRAKAIEHYEKFLDLWKDADLGIAEVEDAKKRLAGLT